MSALPDKTAHRCYGADALSRIVRERKAAEDDRGSGGGGLLVTAALLLTSAAQLWIVTAGRMIRFPQYTHAYLAAGDQYLVVGFVVASTVLAALWMRRLWQTRFSDVPPAALLPGVLVAGLASPFALLLAHPAADEVAAAAGPFFLLLGLFFLWARLRRRTESGGGAPGFALAGACWALAVAARASLAPAVAALALLAVWRIARVGPWRAALARLVALAAPLAVGAFCLVAGAGAPSAAATGAGKIAARPAAFRALLAVRPADDARPQNVLPNLYALLATPPRVERKFPFLQTPDRAASVPPSWVRRPPGYVPGAFAPGLVPASPFLALAVVPALGLLRWKRTKGRARSAARRTAAAGAGAGAGSGAGAGLGGRADREGGALAPAAASADPAGAPRRLRIAPRAACTGVPQEQQQHSSADAPVRVSARIRPRHAAQAVAPVLRAVAGVWKIRPAPRSAQAPASAAPAAVAIDQLPWLVLALLVAALLPLAADLATSGPAAWQQAELMPAAAVLASVGFWQVARALAERPTLRRLLVMACVLMAVSSVACGMLLSVSGSDHHLRRHNRPLFDRLARYAAFTREPQR